MRPPILVLCAATVGASSAAADVATFDSFPEGLFNTVITDDGIQFTNLDQRLEGNPVPAPFVIENAANMLWREAGFTSPNALGFGVYSPGAPVTFSRLGSFDIIPARPAARIALHVFEYGHFSGCTIDLTVSRLGKEVGALSIPVEEFYGLHHYVLDFDGPTFDHARLSIGPEGTEHIFALIDTVTIDDALPCLVDWDGSGVVNSADFFLFLTDFFAQNADFNADKITDSRDFFDFLTLFFAGC